MILAVMRPGTFSAPMPREFDNDPKLRDYWLELYREELITVAAKEGALVAEGPVKRSNPLDEWLNTPSPEVIYTWPVVYYD